MGYDTASSSPKVASSMLDIAQIPVLRDNYLYLVRDPTTETVAAIDPAVFDDTMRALDQRGWHLTHILNTHHHADHTGANLELKKATGCQIVGPRADAHRIPGIDVLVGDEDEVTLGGCVSKVFDVPGHTSGHICYWFADSNALFCGDTIFSIGCGRLFEGTPKQMWHSLKRLRSLPDDTLVFCAHEYTAANIAFAMTLEPEHPPLLQRAAEVKVLRAQNLPTVPSTIAKEKNANPFLRADDPRLQSAIDMAGAQPVEVFAEIRRRKDIF